LALRAAEHHAGDVDQQVELVRLGAVRQGAERAA
jgi:hypothetical protein